jgi:hypothetical protein
MAPNKAPKEPVYMPGQGVSPKYGVAGYRGSHVIVGEPPKGAPAVVATPKAEPHATAPASFEHRKELVRRAVELGLKGSGTNAEIEAAIATRESELAALVDQAAVEAAAEKGKA